MSSRKNKLFKELESILSSDQKRLMQLITVEERKDMIVFRMPKDVISLDVVWQVISEKCKELSIKYKREEPFATLSELDDLLGEVNWVWKDWLPKGFITMCVGDPGCGKSMFALDLIRIATSSNSKSRLAWPLTEDYPDPQNVVWIDTEASQQLLNIRSKQLHIDRNRVYIPVIDGDLLGQPNIGVEEHRETIMNLVTAKKPSVLVLDSLGGSHTRGENKVEEMRPIMEFFAILARDTDTAALVIHHLNKGSSHDTTEISLYRLRGSTIIPALARTIFALEQVKDKELRLRMIKSNLTRIPPPIAVIPVYGEDNAIQELKYTKYEAPASKKTKKEYCASWIVSELGKSESGIRIKDLIEKGESRGYTKSMIYSTRDVLGDRVTVEGDGRTSVWILTRTPENDDDSIHKIANAKRSK